MKRNSLLSIIALLGIALIFLLGVLFTKKNAKYTENKAVSTAGIESPKITPGNTELAKLYQAKDGSFQLRYPDSWILVETSTQSAVLARDAVDTSAANSVSENGIKLRVQILPSVNSGSMKDYVQCDSQASGCDILTFNDQPYKVTEMSKDGITNIMYETVRGAQRLEVKVIIGSGVRRTENIEMLTSILSSFYWK